MVVAMAVSLECTDKHSLQIHKLQNVARKAQEAD